MNRLSEYDVPRPVAMSAWGKDHWSTFAYLETLCVDAGGLIANARMRPDAGRHPGFVHPAQASALGDYPTRLKDGLLPRHDDWDCLWDLMQAGLVEIVDLRLGQDGGVPIKLRPEELPFYLDVPIGRRGPLKTPTGAFVRPAKTACRVTLTASGQRVAALLRQHKSAGGNFGDFDVG